MKSKGIWVLVFALCLLVSLNKHSRSKPFTYHGEIWSDKAGYYMFLPALFNYGFEASRFPSGMDTLTGNGFKLDEASNKVLTKYPLGVAIMISPFYAVAELIGGNDSGLEAFGPIHHKSINWAAAFYLTLGLLFFWTYLQLKRPAFWSNFGLVVAIWLGTNLFHYSILETGLSHVYSFCCFAALLLIQERYSHARSFRDLVLAAFVSGLIVAIRPTNIIFIPIVLSFDSCLRDWLKWDSLKAMPFFILPLVPQFLYWLYKGADAYKVSYANEGFDNLLSPKVFHVLFAPENGWILYTPLAILLIIGVFDGLKNSQPRAKWSGLTLLFILGLYSTWWSWQLGCGFGHRGFVDHYAVLAVPFALRRFEWSALTRKLVVVLMILMVIYNVKLTYTYDYCWNGLGTWDWNEFVRLLTAPTK